MFPFWVVTSLVWLAVLVYSIPGAWAAAVRRSNRRGDPMRLAVFLVAAIMVFGNARWIWRPLDETLWKGVLVVAIVTGLYVISLMRAYGRGPLLDGSEDEMVEEFDESDNG